MKIISIDPGYERVGIAILERETAGKEKVVYSHCFRTDPKTSLPDRLYEISKKIKEVIEGHSPEALAIETLFFKNNKTTGMGVSEARGAIIAIAKSFGLSVNEIFPVHVKIATTGYGKASKDDVHRMVQKLVKLPDKKMLDDEIDAIAIGLAFFASYRPK